MGKLHGREWRPYSNDAEQGVIAACILDEEGEVMPYFIQKGFKEAVFYVTKHQIIWGGLKALYDRGQDIDEISLATQLDSKGELDAVGQLAGINEIIDRIDTTSRYQTHGQQVLSLFRHREMMLANEKLGGVLREQLPFDEIEGTAREVLTEMSEISLDEGDVSAEQVSLAGIEKLQARIDGKSHVYSQNTIYWPFGSFNRLFGPLDPTGKNFMYTIAAGTGEGKSSLTRQLTTTNLHRGKRVLFFLLEGTVEEMLDVMAAQSVGIDLRDLPEQPPDLIEKFKHERVFVHQCIVDKKLFAFEDDRTIEAIEARCRQVSSQFGRVDLVIIDYIQKVASERNFGTYRVQELGYISSRHYEIGKSLGCPCIALAQLNRDYARDKPADINWLRESASMGQDSDGVMFITWPTKDPNGHEIHDEKRARRPIKVYQVKRRSGPKGSAWMQFCGMFSRLEEIPPVNERGRPKKEKGAAK